MRKAFVVLAVIGCSGSSGGGFVPIDQAAQAFKQAECNYLARCGEFPDVSTCLAASLGFTFTNDPSLAAAVAAGKVIYDGNKLGQCYDQFGALSCDRTSQDARVEPAVCRDLVQGTVAANGVCANSAECKSQSCMVPTCGMACCMGTCVGDTPPPVEIAIGQSCATTSSRCVAGAFCDMTATCAALKPSGATCNSSNECDYELGCAGTPRVCKALPTVGQACPDALCRDSGSYCNSSGMCVMVGLPSATCATAADCSAYYTCDATKHCAPGPRLGEACSSTARCFDDATFCDPVSSTCKALEANGTACTSNSQCQTNNCDTASQTCATKPVCI